MSELFKMATGRRTMATDESTYKAPFDDVLGEYDVRGFSVDGRDGSVVKVDDATYDEPRGDYVVVDTGTAFLGKKVFLPSEVITRVDVESKTVVADVAKDDVKNAPEYDPNRRLDDDLRAQVASHYGISREETMSEGAEQRTAEEATATGGMEKIRSEEPVENTIHNVIQTLSVKLDSAARYDLYRDDARNDGYDDCVDLFTRLQERERESIRDLTTTLARLLPETGEARRDEGSRTVGAVREPNP
jgi:hypothetical protein